MKNWQQAMRDSKVPGALAGAASLAAVAIRGRRDSGSALAPVNASSHVFWGEEAGRVEAVTARHTLPGLLINTGAGFFWALVFQKLFGAAADRRGAPIALAGGAATAALAYTLDYKLLPRRLSPGWEQRISGRSLLLSLGAMGLAIGLGSILSRRDQVRPR
jgi:hypothetical protein